MQENNSTTTKQSSASKDELKVKIKELLAKQKSKALTEDETATLADLKYDLEILEASEKEAAEKEAAEKEAAKTEQPGVSYVVREEDKSGIHVVHHRGPKWKSNSDQPERAGQDYVRIYTKAEWDLISRNYERACDPITKVLYDPYNVVEPFLAEHQFSAKALDE